MMQQQKEFQAQLLQMQFELHRKSIEPIPEPPIEPEFITKKSTFFRTVKLEQPEHNNNNNRVHHELDQRFKEKENKYGCSDDEDLFEQL